MSERRSIVELWKSGRATALVTLVRVEGSSYRRPGARLLITGDGDYRGAISGGCLEAEVIRKAHWKVQSGAVVDRYSTMFDDTAEIPYGLGCGGTVDLLLEPANTPEAQALFEALEASLAGHAREITTSLPHAGAPLQRLITDDAGRELFRSHGFNPATASQPQFHEGIAPPQRLLIFGAGDDAQPLVRLADLLGWRTAVIDSRTQWAQLRRFPQAEHVATSLDAFSLTSSDAVVLMTHSYEQDRGWLQAVLPHRPRYLGLLGARHRSALLLSEAAERLGWPLEKTCEGIFAPLGLDLGGDGAEAIALAIIAEIQAAVNGKLGAPRRMSADHVREHLAKGGASIYLQASCAL